MYLLILPLEALAGPKALQRHHAPLVDHVERLANWIARELRAADPMYCLERREES